MIYHPFTTTSARKRLVQKLTDEDIPPNQIIQITGHRNINSLNNYSALNNQQSRNISNILSGPNRSTPTVPMHSSPKSTSSITAAVETDNKPPGFFVNSTFHGNVTFNFSHETQNLSQITKNMAMVNSTSSPDSPVLPRRYKRIKTLDSDSE